MSMHAVTQEVIKRLGFKQPTPMRADDQDIDSEMNPSSIPDDYKELIAQCFCLMGLPADQISIQVRPVGVRSSGLEVYAAFIKVTRWDEAVISVLSKMPLIEKKIDRLIKQSSMARYSSFAGLWFRSPPSQDRIVINMH
ncbi:MAG: hypothetical protein KXJ61_11670 [Hydrogenophaga sp.]|jgi:hypothetical protein|uniref:hypothetical protein n=3 Tax=Hydrogenophaga sp. TaxID=1904254 RepID=UPI001DFFE325|nr:hypothetical protein [Hydrogenophaga sp.]MBW0170874.1 hypothetical protein [Hydrogenophaga sp.]